MEFLRQQWNMEKYIEPSYRQSNTTNIAMPLSNKQQNSNSMD